MMACAEDGAGTDVAPTREGTVAPGSALWAGVPAMMAPTARPMPVLITAYRRLERSEATKRGVGDMR